MALCRSGLLGATLMVFALAVAGYAQSDRVVITNQPGYSITWDGNNGGFSSPEPGVGPTNNIALAANGTTSFGSSEFGGGGFHLIANVIDGFYGNSASWISDFTIPDTNAFIGLNFGQSVGITNIAWSRDNGDTSETPCANGTCVDRCVGTYTLQVTTASNPGVNTPETGNPATGWVTIGAVTYNAGADIRTFSAYLRHRFEVAANGNPIQASGVRIKVSDGNIAIDEIEVNVPLDPIPPIASFMVIQSAPSYDITWDGNDGKFFDANSPANAPKNRALVAQGSTAFGSSEFGQGVHYITNVNDGLYGNSHSWISDFTKPDTNAFIGLSFGALIKLQNVAWSRDNGNDLNGQEFTDRSTGIYTLQITRVTNPGVNTPDTGDGATGWVTIGTVNYKGAGAPFTPWLRHRFDLAMANGDVIAATGLRIKVPDAGTAIDEIEVNVKAALELDLSGLLEILPDPAYTITWDGNDGDFFSPAASPRTPNNLALAANGGVAFSSSDLGFGIHFARKINDGFYGNSSSWISDRGVGGGVDMDPYVGIKFPTTVDIRSIAWGRDNGDTTEAGCGGTCLDRCLYTYTLQVTTVANPGTNTVETGDATTGWVTFGTVTYILDSPPGFRPSMRHLYEVSAGGNPIRATGLRIKVSDGNAAIDELEVNPEAEVVAPPISDLMAIQSAAGYSITWDGNDGEYSNPDAGAPAPGNAALAANGTTAFGSSEFGQGVHYITNVIDGLYGNGHSWISDFTKPDTNAFVGVSFGKPVFIRNVAWGRDNGDNSEGPSNPNTDRALGTYSLQVTSVANPGVDTPETGNQSSGWATVGTLEYKSGFTTLFNPYLRHRFTVAVSGLRIAATGLRIKVSDGNLAIDEIEVNPGAMVDNNILVLTTEPGYSINWDGNDGEYKGSEGPPNNAALAKNGAVAFGSSELGLNIHFITNINDGLYGNAHSWIGADEDAEPFVGITFATTTAVSSVAWSRDNGSGASTDRAGGTYTLQVTTLANPGLDTQETGDAATGWATVGTLLYRGASSALFHPYLRHSWDVAFNSQPIPATGIRIKVPASGITSGTDIDEIEVNTELPELPAVLSISLQANNALITWTGTGVLQSADQVTGPYSDVAGAPTSPFSTPIAGTSKFYRVRR